MSKLLNKTLVVNGVPRTVLANPDDTLAKYLRVQLHLTGTKIGCGTGECGACTVIVDGKVVRSCVVKMKKVQDGAEILTIEGIGTPDNLHALQIAFIAHGVPQCGFCIPGFIVSAKGLFDVNINPTREDVRDWFQKHRNICRCTGYKQVVDAVMDAARLVRGEIKKEDIWFQLKEGESIYGSMVPRPSALAKVTGTCDYGADLGLKLPEETLHIKLVQAKVSHANIISIDTSEAEKMPGVYRVLTHKDVKGKNRITGLITFPTNKGDGWDRPILNDKKIFQFGDAIAMVLADTPCNAAKAAEKVKVEIEELPAYMSAPAAMADDAIEIHPGTPNIYCTIPIIKGEDTKSLIEKLPYVAEGEFYVGRQPHLPIEPDVGFAYMDENDNVIIHSKSVGIHLHAAMIGPGLGVDPSKLFLVQNPTGGTFGYKFCPTMEALLGVATMATGKPVFLEYDYFQQITYTGKRSPFWIKLKMGADENGKLVAMESDWSVDHGPYSEFGDLLTMRGSQFIGAGYNIPNIRGEGRTVCTNHCWGAPFRAYGSPQSLFASESLMDILAEKIGIDPFEFRYQNVYREGSTTPTGQEPEVIAYPQMFDTLRPRYQEALKNAKKKSTADKKCGVGVSILTYGCGLDGADSSEAWVELIPTGVAVGTSWEDHGQGGDAGTLVFAHEALRRGGYFLQPENIKLVMNDTRLTPNSGPAGGSRLNVMCGNAIKDASEKLIAAMKKPNGTLRTYNEMVADKIPLKYDGKVTSPGVECSLETSQGSPFPIYMYGVVMSEVTVDMNTGKTTVDKMTMVSDCGTITNRHVLEGQLYGGLVQGIGLALTEDFEDLNYHTSMTRCGIPAIKDVPDDIEIIHQETPRPFGPFGAAGSGELPLSSPHTSIINAIYNATGVRIQRLPALPEIVLEKIKALKK